MRIAGWTYADYTKIASGLVTNSGTIQSVDLATLVAGPTSDASSLHQHLSGGDYRFKYVEIDFGSVPTEEKSFTITDAEVVPASKIIAQVAYVAPTGKELDELEFDPIELRCSSGTGSFTLYAIPLDGPVHDKFVVNYTFNV